MDNRGEAPLSTVANQVHDVGVRADFHLVIASRNTRPSMYRGVNADESRELSVKRGPRGSGQVRRSSFVFFHGVAEGVVLLQRLLPRVHAWITDAASCGIQVFPHAVSVAEYRTWEVLEFEECRVRRRHDNKVDLTFVDHEVGEDQGSSRSEIRGQLLKEASFVP